MRFTSSSLSTIRSVLTTSMAPTTKPPIGGRTCPSSSSARTRTPIGNSSNRWWVPVGNSSLMRERRCIGAPARSSTADMDVRLIDCDRSRAQEILAILNDAIEHSTALYDYRPRTMAMMESWFDAKEKGQYPVIGAVDESDRLLGFASYGPFRNWPAYKYSVEHSVYVDKD